MFSRFPAVTICNMNPWKRSAIEGNAELSKLLLNEKRKRKKRELGKKITFDQIYYCEAASKMLACFQGA